MGKGFSEWLRNQVGPWKGRNPSDGDKRKMKSLEANRFKECKTIQKS
jgi:hypothetical protein